MFAAADFPSRSHELPVFGAGQGQVGLEHEEAIHLLADLLESVLLLLLRLLAGRIVLELVRHHLHHLLDRLLLPLPPFLLLCLLEHCDPLSPAFGFSFDLLEELIVAYYVKFV